MQKPFLWMLFLLSLLLAMCRFEENKKPRPFGIKGQIDLSEWDFERDGPVVLKGEWEFFWNRFNVEIKESDQPYYLKPGFWDSLTKNKEKIGGIGYGTYRLHIQLPSNPPELSQ
ncbi:MAG: hypothetical protein H7A23_24770 [Leptospiraceae bacterium]|nr:hypothetical protein [Leptospiraceae bacterium]MCP5497779.1 hypothetical protein [Leptospiraceae bacterium]